MSGLRQQLVLAPDDGSLGPLLRIADDRLAPGAGYGRHEHRAVDVVAVVLAGEVRHRWTAEARLRAGDVAVLRAGTGLDHDEVAGDDGARVLQAYLRSADPAAAPSHQVLEAPSGWVDLGRPDARLWIGPEDDDPPPGLRLIVGRECTAVLPELWAPKARDRTELWAPKARETVVVWQLDIARPAWAAG